VYWSAATVMNMLRNPAYKGQAAYGRRCSGPRRPRLRAYRGTAEQPRHPVSTYSVPPERWLTIPVPAIVEADLFAAVGEQLAENQRRARLGTRQSRYLLQGLLVCASCGRAYCGQAHQAKAQQDLRQNPNGHGYYRCGATVQGRAVGPDGSEEPRCTNPLVRVGKLDDAVWADVRSLLAEPKRIEQEFERRLKRPGQGDAQASKDLQADRATAAAAAARRGIARLIDAYRDGLLEKTEFEPRLAEARLRLAKLEAEIQLQLSDEDARREMRLVIDTLATFSEQVKAGLADADWHTRRELIRALVKRIEVAPQEVRVVYKVNINPFEPGPKKGRMSNCKTRVDL
jgi:site-specific DNA recombinase